MIAAGVDARPYAHWPFGRLKRPWILLRLRVRDAVAAQESPGTGDLAEPAFHLCDDESPQLHIRQLVCAENSR